MSAAASVMWFRRDLRLEDHPALERAVDSGEVLPLFVIDPVISTAPGPRTGVLWAMVAALRDATGGALVVRHGDPAVVVADVAARINAGEVHVTRDHTPYGRARDHRVADALRAVGARLVGTGSNYVIEPGGVTKDDGLPYAVFTPFRRRWTARLADVGQLRHIPAPVDAPWCHGVDTDDFPVAGVLPDGVDVDVDTASALSRWERFRTTALDAYDDQRDAPAVNGTSKMGAALRFGLVHPGRLLSDLAPGDAGHDTFASELAWRDFYADVLHRRPETAWENLDRRLDGIVVDTDAAAVDRFERWCAGMTGFDIVDAGMRQLSATGWMHNRVRMIVASFLVKDLHLPWQWGARHFMAHLVDGDLASNNHGWQWAAGTGTDAAPYFRVFNPTTQAQRWDPRGEYRQRWVPELGSDAYPAPMVDHSAERAEALRRYEAAKR